MYVHYDFKQTRRKFHEPLQQPTRKLTDFNEVSFQEDVLGLQISVEDSPAESSAADDETGRKNISFSYLLFD